MFSRATVSILGTVILLLVTFFAISFIAWDFGWITNAIQEPGSRAFLLGVLFLCLLLGYLASW